MLGWMYVVPLLLFVIGKGRDYYMGPAYPMMYAAGAVWGEQWLQTIRRSWAIGVRALAWAALLFDAVLVTVIATPSAPVNSPRWNFAVSQNGDLVEELGWPELVAAVAQVRDSLPESDKAHLGVLVGDYGEAGAVNLYGPKYGLPAAISGINSFWAQWIRQSAARNADRARALQAISGSELLLLPGRGAKPQPVPHRKRAGSRPPGYLCLPRTSPVLAGLLERLSVLRITASTGLFHSSVQ
jgi:hypothetical protein